MSDMKYYNINEILYKYVHARRVPLVE